MSMSDVIEKFSEPINKLLVPVATSAGSTLQDAWELVFGGFGSYVEKKRAVRAHALMEFKNSLEGHIAAIPEGQLREPPLSIVGPALEASKYYFEEPELREMFAKLISASMDSKRAEIVHPSFTAIIKQMSPLDAQNLSFFNDTQPIAEYRLADKDGNYSTIISNVFLANPSVTDLTLQSLSLSSLEHLGLIYITYENQLSDTELYAGFDQTMLYLTFKYEIEVQSATNREKVLIQNGLTNLTQLGEKFKQICLD